MAATKSLYRDKEHKKASYMMLYGAGDVQVGRSVGKYPSGYSEKDIPVGKS